MASSFGHQLEAQLFGQSHGTAIGVVMDGLPAGERIDMRTLTDFLARRRPGRSPLSTPRKESDEPTFLSGVVDDTTAGSPLTAVIMNSDARSADYDELQDTPRPSHADYTAHVKWNGHADMRGGGHFSGRLTAPLCVAGGIAKQILERRGVYIGAHLSSIADVEDDRYPLHPTADLLSSIASKELPVMDDEKGALMRERILAASKQEDSVGGTIECVAIGVPAGLGDPMFGGVENRMAQAIFGIPAIRGIQFGAGFSSTRMRGSEHNDPFVVEDGRVLTQKNDAGGVVGGITNGMPVVFEVAVKPTASIGSPQQSVQLSTNEPAEIVISGRHDPAIAHRAVPVVEAVCALVLLDLMLQEGLITDGNR